ncbi:hypothetical protein [Roseibium aggregatum]|uniref:hypothetical protein n=1 Tax=Roseibium aggregatum TaxID=187304 RepID=UPI001E422905|nr:hypothetical protein [Roseibium aggregatum]UES40372.1 hypothetical protein GFC08_22410 [Roseibium aggregatum]
MKTGLVIFSVIWVIIGGIILSKSAGCPPDKALIVLQCLTANELGDFLAGFFAPLAFIWLAAAVYIQSQELSSQRQELRLTRQELKLTREVATESKEATKAQAEEARRSGDYFQQQTIIMQDDFDSKLKDRALEIWKIRSEKFLQEIGSSNVIIVSPNNIEMNSVNRSEIITKDTVSKIKRYDYSELDISDSAVTELEDLHLLADEVLRCWNDISPIEKEKNMPLFEKFCNLSKSMKELLEIASKIQKAKNIRP